MNRIKEILIEKGIKQKFLMLIRKELIKSEKVNK